MYSSMTFWITAAGCLIVGLLAGWLLQRVFGPSEQRQRELERRAQESEAALRDYREQVTEHFRGTAERINRLTEDYRELHQHLADGATGLCTIAEPGSAPLLTAFGTSAGTTISETTPDAVTQPLDYAPRSSPDAPGILNESYGLDRPHDA